MSAQRYRAFCSRAVGYSQRKDVAVLTDISEKPAMFLVSSQLWPYGPPAFGRASWTTTVLCPDIAKRCAQAKPAGALPATAMRFLVGASRSKGFIPEACK